MEKNLPFPSYKTIKFGSSQLTHSILCTAITQNPKQKQIHIGNGLQIKLSASFTFATIS
jgi:hypothetical protein